MIYSQLEKAISHEYLRHDCNEFIELRERDKGAGTAFGHQCQFCGRFIGREVSKKNTCVNPPAYDPELEEAYLKRVRDIENPFTKHNEEANSNISTISIIDRCNELDVMITSFCTQHGLDKNRFFSTYLIRQREKYIASEFESKWENEEQLHNWLVKNLSGHFEIHNEINGYGFINQEKRNIRIDFILKAKSKLIEHGFTSQYIGVEAKFSVLNPGRAFMERVLAAYFKP